VPRRTREWLEAGLRYRLTASHREFLEGADGVRLTRTFRGEATEVSIHGCEAIFLRTFGSYYRLVKTAFATLSLYDTPVAFADVGRVLQFSLLRADGANARVTYVDHRWNERVYTHHHAVTDLTFTDWIEHVMADDAWLDETFGAIDPSRAVPLGVPPRDSSETAL